MPPEAGWPRVVVDAMGGDNAPDAVVEGAVAAARSWGVPVHLVGDEERVSRLLERFAGRDGRFGDLVSVRHAPDLIGAEEQPVLAVRRKRDSSLVVAMRMVRDGEAEAVVSAGNTGALMAGGVLILGRLDGVDRPAIATVLPTSDGRGVLVLDAGANVDSRPEHLLQFAFMGAAYAELVLGWKRQRVGLLNIGAEESKGGETVKAAYALLRSSKLDFAGNIEARDVFSGSVEVVVCDGFVGNILLKNTEGVAALILGSLKEEAKFGLMSRMGAALVMPALRRLKKKLDYVEYGGAPLLGLKKACIKCHGSSNAVAIANGIRVAARFAMSGAIDALAHRLSAGGAR